MNGPVVGSDTLVEYIRARREPTRTIKAIVLRIDSPGGSAMASDVIWRELMLMRDAKPEKPLVVSMSDLAASGGYYIAMAAPRTSSREPGTLTGSIGIYGGKIVTGGTSRASWARTSKAVEPRRARRACNSPSRPYHRGGAREARASSCRRSTTSSSRRWPRRGT